MYHLFPKKPPKRNEALRRGKPTPADEHFFPMLAASLVLCALLAVNAQPAPQVGDRVFFGGAPLMSSPAKPVNAAIVRDIWGSGAQPCRLNLNAMARADGMVSIAAVTPARVILQWQAAQNGGPIGCPAVPALLAVGTEDYLQMLQWRQTAGHPYFRG